MTSKIELIIVNNAMAFATDETNCQIKYGDDLIAMVEDFYPQGLPLNTFLYHEKWNINNDVTPEVPSDIDKLRELEGSFYLVTYPTASALIVALVSVAVSVAVAFLMPVPVPEMPANSGNTQPPSPNNSLSSRGNRHRIGGRIPDIFGQVWSVPDLIAPTYSVYIDHEEVEYSYMCVGRGKYHVTKALDDTTPIQQVLGATALVFDPDTTLDDAPSYQFGSAFTADEAEWSRFSTKRYTAVNGQELPPPEGYISPKIAFSTPNSITTTDDVNLTTYFSAGDSILIEGADNMKSGNDLADDDGNNIVYSLSGKYTVESVGQQVIYLSAPADVNSDWQRLSDNADFIKSTDNGTLSANSDALWQGWYYTTGKRHDGVFVNVVANNGLYENTRGKWRGLRLFGLIESEIIDNNGNPIDNTLHSQIFEISSPFLDKYNPVIRCPGDRQYATTQHELTDNNVRGSAGVSIIITNPYMEKGKNLRWRIARTSRVPCVDSMSDDIKIKDFYGYHIITDVESPIGVTTVYAKQKATEGALALKERKLKLLVERYVNDSQNIGELKLSKRIDDIIYHLATDNDIGKLSYEDINVEQVKNEVNSQIEYFGTPLTAEFCGTFDTTDVTLEESIQTVAQACMMRAYRLNNQINLHFERPVSAPVATFNSRNMLPSSFEYSESFGTVNGKDGVKLTYTNPDDDTQAVLHYPADESAQNPTKLDLVGVRNKVQAHLHMMRQYYKDQYAYKSCSFSGADETGIVIPSNVVRVANQLFADTQQGAVEGLTVDSNGNPVLLTDEPVDFGDYDTGTVFVQTIARTVDNIKCTKGDNDYQLVLSRLPSQPISTDSRNVVKASYQFVTHDDVERDLYIVSNKKPSETALSNTLDCVNYDSRYYQSDKDFKTGAINE